MRFEKDDFFKRYSELLLEYAEELSKKTKSFNKISAELQALYIDPDAVETVENTSYYIWLTLFLNLRAQDFGLPYRFISPLNAGINSETKDFVGFRNPDKKDGVSKLLENDIKRDESKILVFETSSDRKKIIKEEPILRLTSDQLGFSAICDNEEGIVKNWDDFAKWKSYLLYRYFWLAKDKNEATTFISKYICDTRTLGGAFVWPTDCIKFNGVYEERIYYGRKYQKRGRDCRYNYKRGARSYVEDRVDLTLLEVKQYFDKFNIVGVNSNDKREPILLSEEVLNPSGESTMKTFLDLFGSFEDYIDFFMLNSFVKDVGKNGSKEYVPIDITTDKAFKRNDEDNFQIGKKLSERELEESELKEILVRVQKMVNERTKRMEDYIEKKRSELVGSDSLEMV